MLLQFATYSGIMSFSAYSLEPSRLAPNTDSRKDFHPLNP